MPYLPCVVSVGTSATAVTITGGASCVKAVCLSATQVAYARGDGATAAVEGDSNVAIFPIGHEASEIETQYNTAGTPLSLIASVATKVYLYADDDC